GKDARCDGRSKWHQHLRAACCCEWHAARVCCELALCDRRLAATDRLKRLKAFELRMTEIERLVATCLRMRGAERLRSGPRFKGGTVLPNRVRRIQRVVVQFRPPEKVEFREARHLVEMSVARQPDMLEVGLASPNDLETVHGDEHRILLLSIA